MPDSVARRRELAKAGKMGCPKILKYPLGDIGEVRAAINYYGREDTVKCQGFWARTCRAAKRVGLASPKVMEKCR